MTHTIEILPIEQINPAVGNPRVHPGPNVDKIAASIETYGWTVPLLIDKDNGLIAGHGRLLAAQQLGLKEVPAIRLEHLTPELVNAYRIADNQLTLDSEWDHDLLATALRELESSGLDLAITGFDEQELAQIFSGPNDVTQEWQGMPEYHQDDIKAWHSVTVHFRSAEELEEFKFLIKKPINNRTKFLWWSGNPKATRVNKFKDTGADNEPSVSDLHPV